jgi:hypothetical protein
LLPLLTGALSAAALVVILRSSGWGRGEEGFPLRTGHSWSIPETGVRKRPNFQGSWAGQLDDQPLVGLSRFRLELWSHLGREVFGDGLEDGLLIIFFPGGLTLNSYLLLHWRLEPRTKICLPWAVCGNAPFAVRSCVHVLHPCPR